MTANSATPTISPKMNVLSSSASSDNVGRSTGENRIERQQREWIKTTLTKVVHFSLPNEITGMVQFSTGIGWCLMLIL